MRSRRRRRDRGERARESESERQRQRQRQRERERQCVYVFVCVCMCLYVCVYVCVCVCVCVHIEMGFGTIYIGTLSLSLSFSHTHTHTHTHLHGIKFGSWSWTVTGPVKNESDSNQSFGEYGKCNHFALFVTLWLWKVPNDWSESLSTVTKYLSLAVPDSTPKLTTDPYSNTLSCHVWPPPTPWPPLPPLARTKSAQFHFTSTHDQGLISALGTQCQIPFLCIYIYIYEYTVRALIQSFFFENAIRDDSYYRNVFKTVQSLIHHDDWSSCSGHLGDDSGSKSFRTSPSHAPTKQPGSSIYTWLYMQICIYVSI
jgi:hypothetical protein